MTAWPLIIFLYNLPPEIRFHLENILSLGVIPGPKKPKDIDSFLWPFVEEILLLGKGVPAFDVLSREKFDLRAFLILVFGDIPAISMIMHMKGHNGYAPCRMCDIKGVRVPGGKGTTHYVPLDRSRHPSVLTDSSATKVYDAANLPLRTHDSIRAQGEAVEAEATDTAADRLAKSCGVKGVSILFYVESLIFPLSLPYDFMHLIWENNVKNLILLWTTDYKGLDEGTGSYRLQKAIWEGIAASGAEAGSTIPSAYGPRIPNLDKDGQVSAEMYSFWTLFIGPVLLRRRFTNEKYYKHFIQLVKLLCKCIEFEITTDEIEQLRVGFIKWVKDFEE
jgi:hypothetical protein